MMNALRSLAALVLFPTLCTAAFPTLFLKPVCLQQIHSPTNFAHANDGSGRLFICDQEGKIYVFKSGMLLPTPFLDISSTAPAPDGRVIPVNTGYSERGLLGMAFHPDFSNATAPGYRRFYLYYSAPVGPNMNPSSVQDNVSVLVEYQVSATNPDRADPSTERVLLTFGQPQSNHNGGQLEFGPDGLLYLGTGDGGNSNDNFTGHTGGNSGRPAGALGNSLDRRNLLGKILRLDPLGTNGQGGQYGIPASNPFVGQSQDFSDNSLDGPIRGEIYAYGLRNPWRFSFDKRPGGTNRLFCGDVGQGRVEEVNLIVSGGNYGWRFREGSFAFDTAMTGAGTAPSSYIDPIAQYQHPGISPSLGLPALGLSVTGGYVYRGAAIPALQGKYLFADYGATSGAASGRLMGLEETSSGSGAFTLTQAVPLLGGTSYNPFANRILCMGEDESGELYLGCKTTAGVQALDNNLPAGGIFKVVAAPSVTTVNLTPVKDTSLYAENNNSNGVGPAIFTGFAAPQGNPTEGFPRRALLAFNVSSLPAGVTLTSAQLVLTLTQAASGAPSQSFSLYPLTRSWVEGASNAGLPGGTGAYPEINDASWNFHTVTSNSPFPTGLAWTTPGGDFISTVSATATVGTSSGSTSTWAGSRLVSDVYQWRRGSLANHGWILIGPETIQSGRRFSSREENDSPSQRPRLSVSYTAGSPFETWQATHYPNLLLGAFLDPNADTDGDGLGSQIEYAYGYSPNSFNSSSNFTMATAAGAAGSTDFTVTFRRDSSATDLTYHLQTSSNLSTWTNIATSTAGATAVGANGGSVLSDNLISGTARLVTVRENLPAGSNEKRFVRLQVLRNP